MLSSSMNKVVAFSLPVVVGAVLGGCVIERPGEAEANAAATSNTTPELVGDVRNVAFVIANGTFNSELTAPLDVLHHVRFREVDRPLNVFTVARTTEPVTTFEGLKILPDYSYLSADLPEIDILVVPSGEHSMDADLEDVGLIDFLRRAGSGAEFVMSLCDGAFPLAKTGLLDGLHATTFPGDIPAFRDMFSELAQVHEDVLWVHDGKFITAAGGARSFEPAMYLVEYLYSREVAKAIGVGLVLDWEPSELPHFIAD